MKYFDKVRIIKERECYKQDNISLNEIGIIWMPEIRNNKFYICFKTNDTWNAYKYCMIKIEDIELVENGNCLDQEILEDLPNKNPKWWCKVEDGYIMNLLGEKKNKIPYDYES